MENPESMDNVGDKMDSFDAALFERDALVFRLMNEPTKMSYEDAEKEAGKILREAREEEKK